MNVHNYKILSLYITALLLLCGKGTNAQTTWEFSGTSYSYQKTHFDSATILVRNKLGVQMHTFGAPYNQMDSTLLQVMGEDTSYKVLLYGQINPNPSSGIVNLKNRVNFESSTGVPDYNYFLDQYNTYKTQYTDYMVMQGHPFAWTTEAKQNEFKNVVNYLISEGVKFTTPYDYWRYLNDTSIARTTKVQVILKLDDLRSTTSNFYACLPAYDYLVSRGARAGFGVNYMWGLTQAEIDTLHYYLGRQDSTGAYLFELWNHGLDHSMTSSSSGGNWSDPNAWPSGSVPGAYDDVEIPSGVTYTIDNSSAVCNNLTINGTLVTSTDVSTALTVNGDILINSGGSFTSPSKTGATANIFHSMTVYGDFTNSGGTFDFRQGSSGTTLRALNTTFAGSTNSVITVGTYASSNNDFNGITINKSGGAKIILGSDVTVDPGASTGVSQLNLTSGIIQTGNFVLYVLSTTTSDVVNASSSSYVNGALGRGMSNSAGKANVFAVGDNNGYRPITVRSTTGGTATGHNVVVRCVSGNANIGSTSFLGGIDTVSRVRYYQISYNKGIGSGATSMSFNQFSPSYGTDDGVAAGNYDLRVAYSTDNRTTWNGMTQGTAHLTSLASPPTTITPSQLGTALTLNTGTGYIYAALARVSGTSTNFLPVELISFSCIGNGNAIELNWTTATEKNNFGFDIERKVNGDDWTKIAFIAGHGTTNSPHTYAYTDQSASHGIIYLYRLKQINDDGSFTYSDEISASLTEMPTAFYLYQNYPNPFNPNTKLKIALPKESKASVIVYNTLGETIRTLVDEVLPAGFHNLYLNLPNEASGTYLVRFTADNYVQTKKILLMK